ncbi:MAG TPA: hypothetical protein VE170_07150 [Candidatus Limnocylindria bacterium]|nr:hypothetical protein [Candidatus Limnocylindria bacterium]
MGLGIACKKTNWKGNNLMSKLTITGLAIAALMLPGLVAAQSTPRVDQRQESQEKRIDKGVASGKITQKEAARLEKGQDRVQKTEDRAMKDGKLTKQEKRRIEHTQDVQSKNITRESRDKQTAK